MNDFFNKLLISFFSFFPLKKRKILLFSYYGAQYGCNPKYISQYITEHAKEYDVVWAFSNPQNYNIPGIRKVSYYSLRFFYELCTAKFVITNYRMPLLFQKRKGQIYIQTWHSSLRLKTIEKDALNSLPKGYVEMALKDSKEIDCLLSGCKFSTTIFKSAFWYDGMILECGTPRNDMFFSDTKDLKDLVCRAYSIPKNHKTVLYAPTFRQSYGKDCYNIAFPYLKRALAKRFGGEWTVLVKLHPHLRPYSKQMLAGSDAIDVTCYDDIQELLGASDVLISDYSSLIFDYTFTRRPCFLYVPDLEEYTQNDRRLYFDVKELPFIKTFSNQDLIDKICSFDEAAYQQALELFNQQIGSFEDGTSCRTILDYINHNSKH